MVYPLAFLPFFSRGMKAVVEEVLLVLIMLEALFLREDISMCRI